jgi:hypothetical protein
MSKNKITPSSAFRILIVSVIILTLKLLPSQLSGPLIITLGLAIIILEKIQKPFFKFIRPLIIVLIIGLLGLSGHDSWNILRDISFALTPIFICYIGYWIAFDRSMWPLILKVIIFWGVFFSCYHLSAFILNPELLNEDSMEIRKIAGGSGDLIILAIVLGLFQHLLGLVNLFTKLFPRFIAMPILITSFVLSFSRTELLVGIIFCLSFLGLLSKINLRMVLIIALCGIGYIGLVAITPANEEGTFRSKLLRSTEEVYITDYSDMTDINNNWRGFEAQKAVETYLSGNGFQLIIGQGFGTLIDLGFSMALGGEGETSFDSIPVTHNGYAYILVKVGLLGIICYAFFYINLIRFAARYSYSNNSEQRFMARLLLGSVFSLAASMYVVGGMAEVHGMELALLLGYLYRRIVQLQTNNSRLVIGRNS